MLADVRGWTRINTVIWVGGLSYGLHNATFGISLSKICSIAITVQSISASVVSRPRVKRIPPTAPISSYPIANNIGLGVSLPLLQAEPELMPIPAKFSCRTRVLPVIRAVSLFW